ncbi:hypothetical protein B0H19DRAFT_1276661 [Mycena capillaripes]|nr:hypothetical protein B0H19DRAFT_1276661 [Mycena capillaripes]
MLLDVSDPEKIQLLPVLHVLLHADGMPTVEQLDSPLPSTVTTIDQVVDVLQIVYQMPVPPWLGPDMWPRIWRWTSFIHTYRDSLPGPPLREVHVCADVLRLAANFATEEVPKFILVTPGFQFMVARAWSLLLHPDTVDWRSQQVWYCISLLAPSNPTKFEEIIAGAGGSLHHLSSMVVRCMTHVIDIQASDIPNRTAYLLCVILDFVVEAGDLVAPTHNTIGSLNVFCTTPATRHHQSPLSRGLHPHGFLLNNDGRHDWLPSAISNGFFRALISCAKLVDDDQMSPYLVNMLFDILPSSLIYYGTVSKIEKALRDTEEFASTKAFRRSSFYERWQQFSRLAPERISVLNIFNAENAVRLRACDNSECGNIRPKTEFRRCSGCLCFYYCSNTCQKTHWRTGGHSDACSGCTFLNLGERQAFTARERGFIRALVHHDYKAAKATLYAQYAAGLRMTPGAALFTTFDYSTGPVHRQSAGTLPPAGVIR